MRNKITFNTGILYSPLNESRHKGTMGFSCALTLMEHGKALTRKAWEKDTHVRIVIEHTHDESFYILKHFNLKLQTSHDWTPKQSDLLAGDWVEL